MAIRKDLDDMLNSLMGGGSSEPPKPKAPERPEVHKKSVYDAMSVDDLLNALTEENKPSLAESAASRIDETGDIFAGRTEKPEEPARVSIPPLRKKKKIVISGELPDYEAIRRADLEKDRLERLQAE